MNLALKAGFSFGLTSGIITTLGLMIGLNAGTHSRLAVIGGILTVAIADALSDSLAAHVSEEYREGKEDKETWLVTITTFFAKFFFALTILVPILLFDLASAVWVSTAWGILVLAVLSINIAKSQKRGAVSVVFEHIFITGIVIALTDLIGKVIAVYLI